MIATHRVRTADKNTVGFMIDGVFYTNDYIRQNIAYIANMSLQENGVPEAESRLPELDYKKDIIDQEYDKLVRENPFVRDVQDELLAWKSDKMHQVLQLEGTRQVGKTTELLVNKNEVSAAVVWLKYTGILGVCSLAVNGDLTQIVPDRRMYYADCGIASYLSERYMIDKTALTGLLAETFVYNELHRLFKVPYTRRRVKEDEVCFSVYE